MSIASKAAIACHRLVVVACTSAESEVRACMSDQASSQVGSAASEDDSGLSALLDEGLLSDGNASPSVGSDAPDTVAKYVQERVGSVQPAFHIDY